MADSHINTNKLDYQIVAEYNKREYQPDGSVLFLKIVEEGENNVQLQRACYGGEYLLRMTNKRQRLVKFISIKRNSTNRYYLTACEVGARTYCAVFGSVVEINEWLRENFTARLVKAVK